MANANEVSGLKTYAEFRPSGFDCAGLGLDDRQDWLVAPCSTNRDSDCLQRSNWESQLQALRAADTGEDLEVHSFGHWACGHFDLVLVRPGSACEQEAHEIACALADYPVLSDDHFSELASTEAWDYVLAETRYVINRKGLLARNGDEIETDEAYQAAAEAVWAALDSSGELASEICQPGGGWPSDSEILDALQDAGYDFAE